jgi:hypothetical protein
MPKLDSQYLTPLIKHKRINNEKIYA